MAGTSDYELIDEIKHGQTSALNTLFNRHSPALYEFIYTVIGDRDQTARLLEETFVRAYSLLHGMRDRELVRGWLYGIAREAALTFLRQKNWLNALPPSDEPSVSGLPGDIWRAARAMPAFHRAVLVVEELHGLSPTEKAHALSVARTDLGRLAEDARRTFSAQFDLQARQHGRPLSALIDPERLWGMRRRVGTEGSLFGYLPQVILPESLAETIRQKVVTDTRSPGRAPTAPAPVVKQASPPPPPPPPPSAPSIPIKPEEPTPMPLHSPDISFPSPPPSRPPRPSSPSWSARVLGIIIALALLISGIAVCAAFLLTQDRTPPVITSFEPADSATLSSGLHVTIRATFQDNRAIDPKRVTLVVDARDVTSQALVTDTSVNYVGDLEQGAHVVLLRVRDTSGNEATQPWQFSVAGAPEATPTPLVQATPTLAAATTSTPLPLPTLTPFVVPTSLPGITATRSPLPVVNEFSANQTLVSRGTSVLLRWNVTNADLVNLNQERVDPLSFRLVTPDRTTTYQLIAANSAGTVLSSVTITIQELPDLVVSDIALTPLNQISFAIRNDGTADVTRNFYVQVLANNINVYFDRPISALPVGQEARFTVQNFFVVGTQNIVVRVNTQREVLESNFNNNELARTLTGPTPVPTFTSTSTTQTPTGSPTLTNTPIPPSTPTPSPTSYVTNVTIAGSPSSYSGTCPMTINLTGTISTNGPSIITYQWDRNGTLHAGPFSASSIGSMTTTTAYTEFITGTLTAQLHVTSPTNALSISLPFTNSCH